MYVCALRVSDALGSQTRAMDLPELSLWMIVIHHVGPGNGIPVLCESNKCS